MATRIVSPLFAAFIAGGVSSLKGQPVTVLPFVQANKRGFPASYWHVPPTNDYAEACEIGRGFAAMAVQYLRDNPSFDGLLSLIVRAVDFGDNSDAKGYRVGFLSHWEHITTTQPTNLSADLDAVNQKYRAIIAAREVEAAARELEAAQ